MGEGEMDKIADFIDRVIKNLGNKEKYFEVADDVKAFCQQFPLYTERQG
jgi:glycine/serine hydroxymethyltransferase